MAVICYVKERNILFIETKIPENKLVFRDTTRWITLLHVQFVEN